MSSPSLPWLLLVATLPTESATARMRIWRSLKNLGGAALRDGTYLLPNLPSLATSAAELCNETRKEGGSAWVLSVEDGTSDESAAFRALFDRQSDYDSFLEALNAARQSLSSQGPTELNRLQRRFRKEYEAIRAIDYFPNDKSVQAETAWMDFVQHVAALLESGEPHATRAAISTLKREDHQSRRWATRRHIGVDRVSSAWLISRFIDRQPTFIWLDSPQACPNDALGFDFDGATFTHVGQQVTFEVLVTSFGLDRDPGLERLGALVRSLDIGQGYVPEAAGFEAMLSGLRQQASHDDDLLAKSTPLLDALYASFSAA